MNSAHGADGCDDAAMNAALLVDLLPARLWAAGNLYLVFGHRVHLCVGDGARTVEVDGQEVARGRRPIGDGHSEATGPIWERLWTLDLGWVAAVSLAAVLAVLAVQAGSTRSRANR